MDADYLLALEHQSQLGLWTPYYANMSFGLFNCGSHMDGCLKLKTFGGNAIKCTFVSKIICGLIEPYSSWSQKKHWLTQWQYGITLPKKLANLYWQYKHICIYKTNVFFHGINLIHYQLGLWENWLLLWYMICWSKLVESFSLRTRFKSLTSVG